ncbi:hypothetical protein ACLSU7_03345 [Bdellovibrio sp. HCB185ZH]|uniref:hypothetical protein n=1 Tax=Bdellovibrio sp. HCB185ZH TaxID=3394235 RepID=UPI0039A46898
MEISAVFETIITPAINELNSGLPASNKIEPTHETKLIGEGSKIDSLGLVSLIVTIEEHAYSQTKKQITIASEKAVARSSSPFKTVMSLTEYVSELLNETA